MPASPFNPVLPTQVEVRFPTKVCAGTRPSDFPRWYVVTVNITDPWFQSTPYGGAAGHPGAKIFHDTASALYTNDFTTPTNATDLLALVRFIADAFWTWRSEHAFDRVYNGIINYVPEGFTDTIEWTYRAEECTTRSRSSPWNWEPEELHHTTAECAGTSDCFTLYGQQLHREGTELCLPTYTVCPDPCGETTITPTGHVDCVPVCCKSSSSSSSSHGHCPNDCACHPTNCEHHAFVSLMGPTLLVDPYPYAIDMNGNYNMVWKHGCTWIGTPVFLDDGGTAPYTATTTLNGLNVTFETTDGFHYAKWVGAGQCFTAFILCHPVVHINCQEQDPGGCVFFRTGVAG
jgi:hypothetical protein